MRKWCSMHMSTRRPRSEEHTSELQSRPHLVCRLLLEKKKTTSQLSIRHFARRSEVAQSTVRDSETSSYCPEYYCGGQVTRCPNEHSSDRHDHVRAIDR